MAGWRKAITITRPNDTTAYAAGDVIGAATGSTAAQQLDGIGRETEHDLFLTSARLLIRDSSVISGEGAYRLHLYMSQPGSAYGDNAAWDLPSGDRSAYIGFIDFGTVADVGSSAFVEVNGINKQIRTVSGSIWGYLVTQGAYTPTANRVYDFVLLGVHL